MTIVFACICNVGNNDVGNNLWWLHQMDCMVTMLGKNYWKAPEADISVSTLLFNCLDMGKYTKMFLNSEIFVRT